MLTEGTARQLSREQVEAIARHAALRVARNLLYGLAALTFLLSALLLDAFGVVREAAFASYLLITLFFLGGTGAWMAMAVGPAPPEEPT